LIEKVQLYMDLVICSVELMEVQEPIAIACDPSTSFPIIGTTQLFNSEQNDERSVATEAL